MLKEKTGRVTFMPLNRLKPKSPTSNAPPAQDALPLIDKIRFDVSHQKAFQQVFGKTWVCRDLTVAAAYVKSHGVNTITLDGDKVDRRGALTGGYHDIRRSRIEAIKNVASWRAKWDADEKRSKEVKSEITKIEQEITRITGKIQVLTIQQAQARESRENFLQDANSLTKERERLDARVFALETEIVDLETELSSTASRAHGYREELSTPLTQNLTDEEANMMDALGIDVQERRRQVLELGKTRSEVSCGFDADGDIQVILVICFL
jgi:structural maintenance of chromosome 3 (chondroitin sulfate proteoglycan 6)